MNLESFLQQAVTFAGTFNFRLVIILFAICFIGEFHIAVPYLLETIWLLAGYRAGAGGSPLDPFLLWLAAQAGRQVGATALFYLARVSSAPLKRLFQKYFGDSLPAQMSGNNSMPVRLLRRMKYLSPLSIAMGRLLWMRIPLTLALGIEGRLVPLWIGVALSSLVWDGIYIAIGIFGGRVELKPTEMLLYSLAGLTVLYALTFIIRRTVRRIVRRRATN